MKQAVFLVGGLGSRLGDVTRQTPKPLLPVSGRPFLDYLVEDIARHGITDVLFLAQFEADQVSDYCNSTPLRARFGLSMNVAVEPDRAGTGGALWHARDHLDDRFLLLNGDSWVNGNYLSLSHILRGEDVEVAIALRRVPDVERYGQVTVDGKFVTSFAEKNAGSGEGYINAGVYAMSREILGYLTPDCSLERDVLPRLVDARRVGHVTFDGYFIDIGIPSTLTEARSDFVEHYRRPAVFFDRDGVLNVDHGHVGSVDRFEWMPGAIDAIRAVNDAGWFAFVVTNQAGVAKGYYDEQSVQVLHRHMQSELRRAGAHVDEFRYCPHHPEGSVADYSMLCADRKPGPGMILDLLERWPVDAGQSFLVGDKESDIEAARRASIRAVLYAERDPLNQWLERQCPPFPPFSLR
ncbi:HAD-IIIA family hydrolase [Sphingopyxis kveilinensis]|uniref:HAD-IIIA family hydrolase n=1 Tax=Sphingopyxis kveilinensis TaxID=3114367 RepID=UPI0030CD65FB